MSEYSHILLPSDFSDHSRRAAARALALGSVFGARISVIHVVDYLPPSFITAQSEQMSSAQIIERATAYLAQWSDGVGLGDAEQIVSTGPTGREIAAAAKDRGVDLIVIGTSGEGGMKRLLGSTTRAVIHDAACDVLSIHGD